MGSGIETRVVKEFDPTDSTESERIRLVTTAVTPRPIAWIATVGADGTENLAPYSSYNYVSSRQPAVQFSSHNESHGGLKDTARNVLDTGEFTVNVVTDSVLEQMDQTAQEVPPGVSEFDLAGVERAPTGVVDPPRVAEAAVAMECTLHDSFEIHDRLLVVGDIRRFHISETVLTDGQIDAAKLASVGRLGGPYYTDSEPLAFERTY